MRSARVSSALPTNSSRLFSWIGSVRKVVPMVGFHREKDERRICGLSNKAAIDPGGGGLASFGMSKGGLFIVAVILFWATAVMSQVAMSL